MSFFTKNIFSIPETSVIGIDIGSSSLKIVQIKKKKGRAVLETYGELGLGPYNKLSVGQIVNMAPKDISLVILDLIKEAEITTLKGGMAIPLKLSLVSVIDVPPVAESELATVIPLEARKYIPVPINEVTMDWFVIPSPRDTSLEFIETENDAARQIEENQKKIHVLMVAIHNQVLNSYTTIVNETKLQTSFFEVEAFATSRASLSGETTPVMIVDFGASSLKLYIIDNGLLVSSHTINRGGQDITFSISKGLGVTFDQAEHLKRSLGKSGVADESKILELISVHQEYAVSEVQSVISAFQKKFNKTIGKVLLTGGSSGLKGFLELMQKSLACEVMYSLPFAKVETPAFLQEALKTTGLTFAPAIGLALRALQD
ncbi:MAG: pilus assembly protein PilM [Patescibacteria group bacterium]